jgi:cystathionine beta-lyase
MSDEMKSANTALVEGGRRREWRGRIVNPPVERASTILFDSVAELRAKKPGRGLYG